MRYEDEIDRSRRRQSRGRETVKRSGNRNPAPNRQKELTLITDSFKEDARRRNGRTEGAYGGPQKSSSRKKTSKKEKKAMTVSLYGNLFFVILELIMAVATGSQAVLLDAVYDGIEFFMLLPSVFLIPLLYKPSNEKYPFGHMQMETFFLVIKGITMTAVTVGLISNSIHILLHGGRTVEFETVAWFELSACILGIAVTLYLKQKNKNMNSPIVTVEMEGWKIDSIISLGMTAAFLLPYLVPFAWFSKLTPYLDSIFTIILSMIMLPVPIKTVITGIRDLLLISPEEETVQEIKDIVEPIIRESNCSELSYEIVRTGRKLWISAYITLEKDELSLRRFKWLQNRCIVALAEKYSDFYFELLPEIEFNLDEVKELASTTYGGEEKHESN